MGYTQIQAEEMIKVMDKKMKHDFATKSDLKDLKHAMEIRFEKAESSTSLRFEKLESSINLRFGEMDLKFADMDRKSGEMENRLIQKMGVMFLANLTLTVSVLSFVLK